MLNFLMLKDEVIIDAKRHYVNNSKSAADLPSEFENK